VGGFYVEHEYWFAATQLFLAMLGMGATLRVVDFVAVLRVPTGIGVGLFTQLVCVPLLALAIARLLDVPPGVAVGLFLVAAVPGGTISNVLTYLARGNAALSIALTAVSTLGCLVTAPILMQIFAAEHLSDAFEMPVARVSREIAFTLLGPLGLGMLFGARYDALRLPFSRWCIRGSLFVILMMVIGGASAGRIDPGAYGWVAPAAILALCVAGMNAGMLLCRGLGLPPRDRIAIGIEAGVRNTNLALLIKASVFPAAPGVVDPIGDGAFFVALLYGGIALPVVLTPLLIHRRLEGAIGRGRARS
jgi:BASS family bile acid:Na+ symporter